MMEPNDVIDRGNRLAAATSTERLRLLETFLAERAPLPAALAALVARCVGDPQKAVQRRAADVLARIEDRSAVRAALDRELESTEAHRRWGATYALGLVCGPEPRLLPVLLDVLGDADGDRRWAAAELTVRLGRREAITNEIVRIVTSGTSLQRKMAVYCLRDLGAASPDAASAIRRALGDAESSVRLAALAALGSLPPSETAARAVAALLTDDPEPGVRRAAAVALGRLVDFPAARDALSAAANSADMGLRRAAARALSRGR